VRVLPEVPLTGIISPSFASVTRRGDTCKAPMSICGGRGQRRSTLRCSPLSCSRLRFALTQSGKKYHCDGCRYLASSKIPISLKDAKARGYTACKVCRPPE